MSCGVELCSSSSPSLITQILPLSPPQILQPLCHKYNSGVAPIWQISPPNTTSVPLSQISSASIALVSPHKHVAAAPYCAPQCRRMRRVCLASPYKHGNSGPDIAAFIPNQFLSAVQTCLMFTSVHLETTWKLQWRTAVWWRLMDGHLWTEHMCLFMGPTLNIPPLQILHFQYWSASTVHLGNNVASVRGVPAMYHSTSSAPQ